MPHDIALATVASMLRRGSTFDRLSSLMTGAGLIWGMLAWPLGAGSIASSTLAVLLVLTGILEKYWAVRVGLDADLFDLLAQEPLHVPERTDELDQAMVSLGLIAQPRAGRSWPARTRGALRLLRAQVVCVAFQSALAVASLFAMPWLHSPILY